MTNTEFRFSYLPTELRDLIWKQTLPQPRLFQLRKLDSLSAITPEIQQIYKTWFGVRDLGQYHPSQICSFNIDYHHPPPIATQVCRESRKAACRAGFLVVPIVHAVPGTGVVWFGGHSDFLYCSLPDRNSLDTQVGKPIRFLANSDRIRNVALEWQISNWGALFDSITHSDSSENLWRKQILALYDCFPGLTIVYLEIPIITRSGVYLRARDHENLHMTPARLTLSGTDSHSPCFGMEAAVGLLRKAFERAHDSEKMAQAFGDSVRYPPEVGGFLFHMQELRASSVSLQLRLPNK